MNRRPMALSLTDYFQIIHDMTRGDILDNKFLPSL